MQVEVGIHSLKLASENDGWKTIFGRLTFQGRTVKRLAGVIDVYSCERAHISLLTLLLKRFIA